MPLAPALLLLAQLASPSARPGECLSLEGRESANVWERAKSPALRKYCDLLAGGAAKLASGGAADEARLALALADEAAAAFPDRAAPLTLRGRALARLGQWKEALCALEQAKSRDPRAFDDPAALLAWARALGRGGRTLEAEEAFRLLLPRASDLPPAERGAAGIEAALLALSRGPAGIDEAIAMLREARKDARDTLQTFAALTLALALDRAEQREESRLLLSSVGHVEPRELLADAHVRDVLTDANAVGEGDAIVGLALDGTDPAGAREAWAKYVSGAGGKGPWAENAREHEGKRGKAK